MAEVKILTPSPRKLKYQIIRHGFFTRFPMESSLAPELTLWRTVLDKALLDLFDKETQGEIISWLCNDYAENEQENLGSFEDVCDLSMLPTKFVYNKFIEVLFLVEKKKNGRRFGRYRVNFRLPEE